MKDNKKLRIAIDIVLILVAGVFLFFGVKDMVDKFNELKVTDDAKFSHSYQNVGENHYKYLSEKELEKVSTGVVFVGNPNDAWSQVLAPVLTDLLSKYDISNVYYYETDENTPRVIIYKNDDRVVELYKGDIYDEQYDGIPIEYFESDENKNDLKSSLDVLESLEK